MGLNGLPPRADRGDRERGGEEKDDASMAHPSTSLGVP